MFILFAHEMGHYLYARHYRVYATPPFFVPFPSLIGTLGAFIRIKSPIPSRAALFDIGIAGPIAGFIPACVGFSGGPLAVASHRRLELSDVQPGFPLVFDLAARLLHIHVPISSLSLHPIAAAAWVGMFATSLNLLPGGQLDGGHILFSISPRLHRWISMFTVLALVPFGKYFWTGWFLWAVLLGLTMRHPRVPRYPDVSGRRRLWRLRCGLMLILSFTPAPFTHSSGREVWPEIRDGARGYAARSSARKFASRYIANKTCIWAASKTRGYASSCSYISHTASTSTITCVRGIFRAAASASMARSSAFIFSRLGDFRMK